MIVDSIKTFYIYFSQTQFVTVIILYTIRSNLADLQFLYIDLFLISVFALFFGHTEPYDGPLVRRPPSASLVSAPPIVSILCHMVSIVSVQVLAFLYVQQQPWFTPYEPKEDDFRSYENYTLFSVSTFQYIIMAIVFSRGQPYRKSLLTNHSLLAALIILTSFTVYLVLCPCTWLIKTFELQLPPSFEFRLTLIGFALCNLVIAIFIEQVIVNFIVSKKLGMNRDNSKNEHVRIDKDLSLRSDWPPLVTPPCLLKGGDRMIPNNNEGDQFSNNYTKSLSRTAGLEAVRRHSSAMAIAIPKPEYHHHRRPRSQNSHNLSPGSEPNHLSSFLNGPLKNSLNDCRIALDVLPPNCKS